MTSHGPNTLKVFAAKHGDFLDIYITLSPLTVPLNLFCTYIKPKFFPYLNTDVLSGTHTSKRTRYFWRASNTLQFELPPSLGPVTTLVPHMTYHLLNHGDSITKYFIPLNFLMAFPFALLAFLQLKVTLT